MNQERWANYMKRLFLMIGLLFILITPQAWGAAPSQYPNPYRQTTWNNLTDSMHTLGQTPQQAKLTKMKLHNARTGTRLKSISHANMAKFKAQRQAWQKSQ